MVLSTHVCACTHTHNHKALTHTIVIEPMKFSCEEDK